MDKISAALSLLPSDIKDSILPYQLNLIEEIRLRCGRYPTFRAMGGESVIKERQISMQEIAMAVEIACGASIQAHMNEIKEGYINYRGLRIGICGTAIYENEILRSFRNVSSLNIRIPRNFTGDVSEMVYSIRRDNYPSTIIISPPGYGKTSLLRELVRVISDGGKTIGVIDDRNELASADMGRAFFDLGSSSDVLTAVKKSEGAMMLLRGMAPDMIAFDEISKKDDIASVFEIAGCGVGILATAHGRTLDSLKERPLYRALLDEKIFKTIISIDVVGNSRVYTYQRI